MQMLSTLLSKFKQLHDTVHSILDILNTVRRKISGYALILSTLYSSISGVTTSIEENNNEVWYIDSKKISYKCK